MKSLIISFSIVLSSIGTLSAQATADSLLEDLKFEEISTADFEKHEASYTKNMKPVKDSKGYFKKHGLSVVGDCDEICETYLVEDESGKKMLLPSDFDAGVLGLMFSPAGKHLIVWSSYDGPDYGAYYSYRSEIIAYHVSNEKGLKAIRPHFNFYSQDWSIEKLIWVNESFIALKIYSETSTEDGSVVVNHKCIKAAIQ